MGVESWYFAEICRGTAKTPLEVTAEVKTVTAGDIRRVLSKFTLSVAYLITKEETK